MQYIYETQTKKPSLVDRVKPLIVVVKIFLDNQLLLFLLLFIKYVSSDAIKVIKNQSYN